MDTNFDGRLNAAEFREAMEKLGMIQLSGPVVSTIFSAMDIHGSLTLQEFLYIIEVRLSICSSNLTLFPFPGHRISEQGGISIKRVQAEFWDFVSQSYTELYFYFVMFILLVPQKSCFLH